MAALVLIGFCMPTLYNCIAQVVEFRKGSFLDLKFLSVYEFLSHIQLVILCTKS